MKQLICAALTILVWSGTANAQELEESEESPRFGCIVGDIDSCITVEEYRNAGLVGTFVGFGSGHLMTGENGRGAWFLTSETLLFLTVATGVLLFVDVIPMSDAMTADFLGGIMYIGGGALLGALRAWEKVDVWKRPRHTRVVRRSARETSLTPLVAPARGRDGAGGAILGIGGTF